MLKVELIYHCFLQGKSVSVKTVDNAIKRKCKNGETVALDSRCADINAEVIKTHNISHLPH